MAAQPHRPYFQQEVNYTISVTLDDVQHTLHGNESFEYINHSPDELLFIYIHLWPNAYKNRHTSLARELARNGNYVLLNDAEKMGGYIDSLDFKVDGKRVSVEPYQEYIDICKLVLERPIPPGGKVTVTTPFFVKIPDGSISRLGHIDQSYQISQWFPKPAVYDQTGWHPIPYQTQGEFYSEFGSFDVRITLPANYVVGATGDLQDHDEIRFLDSLAMLGTHRENLTGDNFFPASSSSLKTIQYVQHHVHDFGWFADKRWMVLKGEVETPHEKNKVTTWAMFTPGNAALWKHAPEYIHDAVYYYSLWNGDYPYRQVTAVDGTISAGGGMEYPNVTVIGNTSEARQLETVIVHEVGHNWFYGILGSNERDHAWMDEGLNSFYEDRYLEIKYPDATMADALGMDVPVLNRLFGKLPQRTLSDISYTFNASRSCDQPLSLSSADFTEMNYGGMVYKKSALIFQYLRFSMGDELFDRCAHRYFNQWKYRHPQPEDMREVFEKTSGRDLSWFFDSLIQTSKTIDYKMSSARIRKDGVYVTVKNVGGIEGPVPVSLMKNHTMLWTVWSPPLLHNEKQIVKLPWLSGADMVKIDAKGNIPEINRRNNTMRLQGVARKCEPLKMGLLTFLQTPDKTQLFYFPLIAWNQYNQWMAGLQLHNRTIEQKPLEWSVAPLYSFRENNVNGFVNVTYRNNRWEAGFHGQKFNDARLPADQYLLKSTYTVAQPFIRYSFNSRLKKAGNTFKGNFYLFYQYVYFYSTVVGEPIDPLIGRSAWDRENVVLRFEGKKELNLRSSLQGKFSVNTGTDIFKTTPDGASDRVGDLLSADLRYDWLYDLQHKYQLSIRGFFGYSLNNNDNRYVWSVAGTTGKYDFFYDQLYLGRSETEGLLARQVASGQGLLLSPIAAAATLRMAACNVIFRLPVKFPLALYGGVVNTFSPYADEIPRHVMNYGSAGVAIPLIRDAFEIYLPVFNSAQVKDEWRAQDIPFMKRIMFQLNIKMANPFDIIRNIQP